MAPAQNVNAVYATYEKIRVTIHRFMNTQCECKYLGLKNNENVLLL